MNRMIAILVFVIIAIALPCFGAWWGVWLAGAALGFFFFSQKASRTLGLSFVLGLVVSLVWSLLLWLDGGALISNKIAQIFSLPNGLTLILASALVNGLIALLGAGLGSSLRQLVDRIS